VRRWQPNDATLEISEMSGDDWQLLDEILKVIRREYHPVDEVLEALMTCMAMTIVMADLDLDQPMIDYIKARLDAAVDFQRAVPDVDAKPPRVGLPKPITPLPRRGRPSD